MAKASKTIDSIKCTNCGHAMPLTEVLSQQVGEAARAEAHAEVVAAQEALTQRERALHEAAERQGQDVAKAIADATTRIRAEAEAAAGSAAATKLAEAEGKAVRATEALKVAQASELALRNQAAALEERAAGLDLEVARKIDEGKAALVSSIETRLSTEMMLQVGAKDKQLTDAMTTIAALQQKLEQGSQQLQGEVLELEIEKMLGLAFPIDTIAPVPKGVNGADILQMVNSRQGRHAGTIIWELKRTKAFNADWPNKLKADQRVAKADIAILVSTTMPEGIKAFGQLDGVWVCSVDLATVLATALRVQLLEVDVARAAGQGKAGKMDAMYEYLTGAGFRLRVEAIVGAFVEMQTDIADERRVAERRWSKREKQVMTVIASTSGMYGDLQGMLGTDTMTAIPQLEDQTS